MRGGAAIAAALPAQTLGNAPNRSGTSDVRWLRPATAPPRVVDARAVGRRLDALGPLDAGAWRAAQLVALLVGADLDGGPGGTAAVWERGTPVRVAGLASRAGITTVDVEAALGALGRAGVLWCDDGEGTAPLSIDDAGRAVRVAEDCVTDGPAAAVAWPAVTAALAGSAAGLLVARALAGATDRPGHPTVLPYGDLVRATRYSEGMVKRGVAAVLASGAVVQHPSRGRAPAYAFSDWALGRGAMSATPGPAPSAATPGAGPAVAPLPVASPPAPVAVVASGTPVLRARLAGVDVEVPAATGAEVIIETVVDGRPVTARMIIPAVRS